MSEAKSGGEFERFISAMGRVSRGISGIGTVLGLDHHNGQRDQSHRHGGDSGQICTRHRMRQIMGVVARVRGAINVLSGLRDIFHGIRELVSTCRGSVRLFCRIWSTTSCLARGFISGVTLALGHRILWQIFGMERMRQQLASSSVPLPLPPSPPQGLLCDVSDASAAVILWLDGERFSCDVLNELPLYLVEKIWEEICSRRVEGMVEHAFILQEKLSRIEQIKEKRRSAKAMFEAQKELLKHQQDNLQSAAGRYQEADEQFMLPELSFSPTAS